MDLCRVIAVISDIHIGAKRVSADSIKKQLKTQFLDVISKFCKLSAIFITGDILHTIVSLNSDYSNVFNWFIDRVYKIAKEKNAIVVIVRGTPSHDNEQLNNIKHYIDNDDGVDFRIYETIEETTLWNHYRVLILPDNRVKDKSLVDQYLQKHNRYDMILGHGTIDTMQFFVQDSEQLSTKAYVYDVDQLMYVCKGPIFFGHIHQYQNIKDQFYYVGSFTTLERGVHGSGFLVCAIDENDHSRYLVERYLNTLSAEYYEIPLTTDILSDYPIDDIIHAIQTIIEPAKENDLISIKISLDNDRASIDKILMIEDSFRRDRRITITKKIKSKQEEESDRHNEERKERYSYLMDQNPDVASIVYRYYKEDVYPTIPEDTRDRITEQSIRDMLDMSIKFPLTERQ